MLLLFSSGAEKPSPEVYRRIAAAAGAVPSECVHVGDRVDNDVVGALAAGMTVVHLRRGPWGVLHADDPALEDPRVRQLSSLGPLPELVGRLRGDSQAG